MAYPQRKDYQKSLPKPLPEEQKVYNFERATAPNNNIWNHIKDKVRQHPFIPLTFAMTCGCFAMMIKNKNNAALLNFWGRWRLGTQGLCFLSVFGAMYQEQSQKTGEWLPYKWFTGNSQASENMRKQYFEKH